jgi:tetratricopeptide (TPR) repeat protein
MPAEPLYRRAIELWSVANGPDHLDVAYAWQNLGEALRWQQKTGAALAAYREGIRIRAARLGESPLLASNLISLAASLVDAKQVPEAKAAIVRAIAILRKGEDRTALGIALMTSGLVFDAEDNEAATRAAYEEAIAVLTAVAPGNVNIPIAIFNLGELATKHGHCDQALPDYQKALGMFVSEIGEHHPNLTYPLTALAKCLVLGKPVDSLGYADRALALPPGGPKPLLAQARFYRGRALVESKQDVPGGLRAAKAARDELVALGADAKPMLDEANAWLSRH